MKARWSRSGSTFVPTCLAALVAHVGASQAQTSTATGLEEVVVTAQKRTEKLLEVPMALSVLGGTELENLSVAQLTDFATYLPGVNIRTGGAPGQATVTLRGISSQQDSATVGVYVDDSPLGSSNAYARGGLFQLDLFPYDMERVEVLRGPQGTLYGASTMGGLLKYVFRAPSLDSTEVRLGADLSTVAGGDSMGWSTRAAANMPIIEDKLAVRGSYFNQTLPGFIDNVSTGERDENEMRQQGGRLALLWQLSDTVSLTLAGMAQRTRGDALSAVDMIKTPGPRYGTPAFGDLTRAHYISEPYQQTVQFYSATLDAELGWGDFTSASSHSRMQTRQRSDITFAYGPLLPLLGFPAGSQASFDLNLDVQKTTQEFRLASSTGSELEWLAGAFFTNEEAENVQLGDAWTQQSGYLGRFTTGRIPTRFREYAGFGNLTYHFTERFDVTGGLRWAKNEQDFEQSVRGLQNINLTGRSSDDTATYMASARYRFDGGTMVYARVASGYRPGGPNFTVTGFTIPPTFDADTLVNYELGVKSQLLEQRMTLELATFYVDWKDIQVTQLLGGFGIIANGGAARSRGVELTVGFEPIDRLRLGLTGAYTDAELTEDASATLGPTAVPGGRLGLVPEWTGALTADYEIPLDGGWAVRWGGGYRYISDTRGIFPRPGTPGQPVVRDRFDAYQLVDMNVAILNDSLTIKLYGRNVFDERAYINGTGIGNYYTVVQPRVAGVGVDVRF